MRRAAIIALAIAASAHTGSAQRLLSQGTRISSGGVVNALIEFDGKLIIGGEYQSFNEHLRPNLQGWDGLNHFDMPGAFQSPGESVRAMIVFDGNLIVAGSETEYGNVARWDGSNWITMGTGLPSTPVTTLMGSNGELYAGAGYGTVAKWNGSAWSVVGQPLSTAAAIEVKSLVHHDGVLYAGGWFPDRLVRWNNNSWEVVPPGLNSVVAAMKSTPDGLLITGLFDSDGTETLNLPGYAVFDGSTLTTPYGLSAWPGVGSMITTPDGRLILGASAYQSWILQDPTQHRLVMQQVKTGAAYQGNFYLAGAGEVGRYDTCAMAVLVDGIDHTLLDANNVHAPISCTSAIYSPEGTGGYGSLEAPAGAGLGPLGFLTPMFSGEVDTNFFLQVPATYWDRHGSVGPHALIRDMNYYTRYQQVWWIDREMIEDHIAHHGEPTYEMPLAIATWPGNGDIDNGEPGMLAPFMDLDNDELYEPMDGEYPLIRGDVAVYTIQHDADDDLWLPQRAWLDRHIMHYAFRNSWDASLNNTIFTNIKLINRSDLTYVNARVGTEMGNRIGCMTDDMVGCDTTLSLAYAYNFQPVDNGCSGSEGYGSVQPAIGISWLSSPMSSHIRHFRQNPNGNPQDTIIHFALQGLHPDGSPTVDPWGDTTTFEFHGDPNVAGSWTEPFSPATPDHHPISATGPFTLAPGDTLCVDLAFVFAQDSAGDNLSSVALLKQYVAQVRQWYQQQNVQCNGSYGMVTGLQAEQEVAPIRIYPNPTSEFVTIGFTPPDVPLRLSIHDARGGLVHDRSIPKGEASIVIPTSDLPNGIYQVALQSEKTLSCARLIVTH